MNPNDLLPFSRRELPVEPSPSVSSILTYPNRCSLYDSSTLSCLFAISLDIYTSFKSAAFIHSNLSLESVRFSYFLGVDESQS